MALMAITATHRTAVALDQLLAEFSHHKARNLFARSVSAEVVSLMAIGAIYSQGLCESDHYLGQALLRQPFKNLKTRRSLTHNVIKRARTKEIGLALMTVVARQFRAILVLQGHCVITQHKPRDVFSRGIGIERRVVTEVAFHSQSRIESLHRPENLRALETLQDLKVLRARPLSLPLTGLSLLTGGGLLSNRLVRLLVCVCNSDNRKCGRRNNAELRRASYVH
jgi:hypothetical protein